MTAVAMDADQLPSTNWDVLCALVELHAVADEACRDLGLPGRSSLFEFHGEIHLGRRGSLAQFPPQAIRVVPKLHTPQRGMTLRSLSHHVSAVRTSFDITWRVGHRDFMSDIGRRQRKLGLLLIPWPFEVAATAFRPSDGPEINMPQEHGFFEFDPPNRIDVREVKRMIRVVQERGDVVDGLVFPEACLTEREVKQVIDAARQLGVGFVLAGVRGKRSNFAITASTRSPSGAEWWYRQNKHHRWCLDDRQIEQYELQGFTRGHRHWEDIAIPPRSVHFIAIAEWLTLCHIICEDLARLDPVDHIIRAVGPNLLVALLQDGPQIGPRWANRFASVYADDPGCSVLTLTSLGMLSWPCSKPAARPPAQGRRPVPRGRHGVPVMPGWAE